MAIVNQELLQRIGLKKRSPVPLGRIEGGFTLYSSYAGVLENLNLTEDQLNGKKILDVGGVGKGHFNREAKKRGFDVTSVDFDYHSDIGKWNLKDYDHAKGEFVMPKDLQAIAGMAEALPIAAESFDLIIALQSVPEYSVTPKYAQKAIDEMVRVVKPGGEIRIAPFIIDPRIAQNVRAKMYSSSYEVPFARFENAPNAAFEEILNQDEKAILEKLGKQKNLSLLLKRLPDHNIPLLIICKHSTPTNSTKN